jgi:pantoate--beta-alanine ligase
MGSLHKGHLSLIQLAQEENAIVICSIFVNPTQFNDPKDYKLYPKHLDKDIELLKKEGCDILYIPEVEDIYPNGLAKESYPLEQLGEVLEGAFRPGHFDGVIEVVKRLFAITEPQKAYFGMKDFQQLAVIRWMVEYLKIPVEIVSGPIIRDESGLALSSRNERLTESQFKSALKLSKSLFFIKDNYETKAFSELKKEVISSLEEDENIKVEYLEIANTRNLMVLNNFDDAESTGVFIAAHVGDIRLIDNIVLF